jgi:hypothetical protein
MALSRTIKACLFLSSYIPLWIILVLFHWSDWGCWLAIPIGAFIGGLVGLGLLSRWVKTGPVEEVRVEYVERQDGDSVAYIVTYILPFLTLVITSKLEALGILGLFVTVMLVYVSSDMLYVNPMLAASGWHAHSIHTEGGVELVLISQRRLIRRGTILTAVRLGDVVWWERESTSSRSARQSPQIEN